MNERVIIQAIRACWAAVMCSWSLSGSLQADEPMPQRQIDLSRFKLTWRDEFEGDRLDESRSQAPAMERQEVRVGNRRSRACATACCGWEFKERATRPPAV